MGLFGFGKSKATQSGSASQGSVSLDRQYGKLLLMLLNTRTRDTAYSKLAEMEPNYPEAGIVVGQYYQGAAARKHFEVAANAGLAEGHWGLCGVLPHSYIPDPSDRDDAAWEKHCLAAAEGGCADACNEMGNVCHRRKWYTESFYWYEMAGFYGHPQANISIQGITREWKNAGQPEDFVGTANYTKERHSASLLAMKMISGTKIPDGLDQLMKYALAGENMAGFLLADIYENTDKDAMAYKVYSSLCFDGNPHALRCYADMLMAGKGTARDVASALKTYQQAAENGEPAAMFVMGEKARKDGDKELAACWYGKAYVRGMEMAGDRLSQLI